MSTSQGIKLDDNTRQRLKSLGEKKQRSPHWLMRTAIEDYLNREEQYEREKAEDLARWEDYVSTGKTVDHKKVQSWLKDLSQGKPRKWQA
jgi:predicted transcriptional regulator